VSLTFRATELDDRNWVVDFGSLKSLKGWLEDMFDHKLLLAEDDPEYIAIKHLEALKIANIITMPRVGMEAMAYYIYQFSEGWLKDNGFHKVTLEMVEVKEHEANWARYRRNP
jgi:6-pyruvoyltetrahydropterin/6-carboxytetrahydropterin synthase